jgi:hypothetical protein
MVLTPFSSQTGTRASILPSQSRETMSTPWLFLLFDLSQPLLDSCQPRLLLRHLLLDLALPHTQDAADLIWGQIALEQIADLLKRQPQVLQR